MAVGLFDPAFALLLALYIAVLVLVLPLISLLLTKRKNREVKQARSHLYRKLTDAVLGIHEWYVSGRQAEFLTGYEADEAEVDRTDRSLKRWSRFRAFIGQGVVAVTVVSVVYWSGRQYADGSIDVTLIAAFVLVVFPLMDAFLPVSEAVERIPQYGQSVARLRAIESADASEGRQDLPKMLDKAEVESVISRGVHVKADGVSFRYDQGQAALRGLNHPAWTGSVCNNRCVAGYCSRRQGSHHRTLRCRQIDPAAADSGRAGAIGRKPYPGRLGLRVSAMRSLPSFRY